MYVGYDEPAPETPYRQAAECRVRVQREQHPTAGCSSHVEGHPETASDRPPRAGMHRDPVRGSRGVAESEHLDRQADAPTGGDDTVKPGVRNIVPARHDAEIGRDRPESCQKSSRTKAFSPTLANLS